MGFEFATAARIVFGNGAANQAPELAAEMGTRTLVVTGSDTSRVQSLLDGLNGVGVAASLFKVAHEPTTDTAMAGIEQARKERCDVVIGFGGGSALDTAKAISAMLTNEGDLFDYLEVIGGGKKISERSAPMIAIPTTAGTGTEVTRNAVLASPSHHVKVSMRSPLMLPHIALVDPELTYSMPPSVTANTGLDALTQVLEPYVSHRANPMIDALCREGLRLAARSLRRVYADGADTTAREDMALTSLFGGLALANAGLGAVHGFAGPIGGMFSAPHGAVCARLLPVVVDVNVAALRERAPDNPALARYAEIARILTGDEDAHAADGVAWVRQLAADLQVPPLAAYGISEADVPRVVEKAIVSSSMKANPIKLTTEELSQILRRAI
jgi:alcohol dehydrogenase class IV